MDEGCARQTDEPRWPRERFFAEGRALAACAHPGLEKVVEVLATHGTACWVTPEETGRSVKQWLAALGRAPTEAELRAVLEPTLDALAAAHAAGLLHLNLKPETIRLGADGQPVLGHFADARQAIARHSHGAGAATAGYSAPEQYEAAATEGPTTDVYALAAVGYRAITGQAPPDAPSRQPRDAYRKLAGRFPAYSDWLLEALDAGLAVDAGARPATVAEWRKMLAPTPLERVQAWVRRDPLASIGGALAVILAVFLLGRAFIPQPDTPKPATPKPETPKPATPKPETPKPATPKPETPKPATPKPATPPHHSGFGLRHSFVLRHPAFVISSRRLRPR